MNRVDWLPGWRSSAYDNTLVRRRERGSLVAILLILATIMVVAFSLVAMAFQHWGFGKQAHHQQVARNLAESLAAQAVARMTAQRAFGTTGDDSLRIRDADSPDAEAFLTFTPEKADMWHVPCSLNNQQDHSADTPGGARVPARTARLYARGVSGSASHLVEVMMYVPPYPYAVVSSGPLTTRGAFVVTGVRNVRDYTGSADDVPPTKRVMVTAASNSDAPAAVSLGPDTLINGDVQAVGSVRIAPGGVVRGAVKQNWDPAPLPDLSVAQYMAACSTPAQVRFAQQVTSATVTDLTVEWLVRRQGDLEVQEDVTMDGGVLYVEGDLHVRGGVKGKGAIIVGGKTTIDHGVELNADGVVALLSRGDVTLAGEDRAASFLQGIVYTEGNLSAHRMTILGSLMTKAPAGRGAVDLEDVTVVSAPVSLGTRGGLVGDPNTDDDEVVWIAYAYQNPSGPGLRYRLSLKTYSNEFSPPIKDLAKADNLTRQEAEDMIVRVDSETTPGLKGANGGSMLSRDGSHGCLSKMRQYFDALENPTNEGDAFLNLDINRLLRPALEPRILLWRPL